MNEVLFAAGAFVVAASVQSLAGFGFGMVSMGLLPLLLPVREAVPIVALLGLIVSASVLLTARHGLSARAVLPPLIGALIGVPLGVAFLAGVEPDLLRPTLGVVLVAFALHGLLRREAPPGHAGDQRWRDVVGGGAGLLAGALGGAFNVGGPPLVLYVAWRRMAPDVVRATLQTCFLVGSFVQIPMFVHHGLVTRDTLIAAGAGLPATGLGLVLGAALARRISTSTFRRIVLLLLLALGVGFLVS